MPMVGQVLRRAREHDGLSLEELSKRTKIKVRLLEAIENNDFQSLPGGIFTRGFLRSYAREVAMDPEAVISRYMAQAEPREWLSIMEEASGEPEPVSTRPAAIQYRIRFPVPNRNLRLLSGLVVLTAMSIYFGSFRQTRPEATLAAASTIDVSSPVGTSGAMRVATDRQLTAEISGLKVDLTPRAPCWIAATADGKPALAKLMNVDDPYRIEAQEEVTLRVGDPGALAIAVNGVPGRPLGQPGTPVTVRITRANYREFIVRQ